MLHISKSVDYAVRILVHLATLRAAELDRIESISKARSLPAKYVRQLIAPMIRSGLVESRRGVGGGLKLKHSADKVSLLDIIEAIDGPIQLGICHDTDKGCRYLGKCPVSRAWLRISNGLRHQLKAITLKELVSCAKHVSAHRRQRKLISPNVAPNRRGRE